MEFVSTYKESHTEAGNRCGYCGFSIYPRRDGNRDSYKLNGKYICLRCLKDYANSYGMTLKELIGE